MEHQAESEKSGNDEFCIQISVLEHLTQVIANEVKHTEKMFYLSTIFIHRSKKVVEIHHCDWTIKWRQTSFEFTALSLKQKKLRCMYLCMCMCACVGG